MNVRRSMPGVPGEWSELLLLGKLIKRVNFSNVGSLRAGLIETPLLLSESVVSALDVLHCRGSHMLEDRRLDFLLTAFFVFPGGHSQLWSDDWVSRERLWTLLSKSDTDLSIDFSIESTVESEWTRLNPVICPVRSEGEPRWRHSSSAGTSFIILEFTFLSFSTWYLLCEGELVRGHGKGTDTSRGYGKGTDNSHIIPALQAASPSFLRHVSGLAGNLVPSSLSLAASLSVARDMLSHIERSSLTVIIVWSASLSPSISGPGCRSLLRRFNLCSSPRHTAWISSVSPELNWRCVSFSIGLFSTQQKGLLRPLSPWQGLVSGEKQSLLKLLTAGCLSHESWCLCNSMLSHVLLPRRRLESPDKGVSSSSVNELRWGRPSWRYENGFCMIPLVLYKCGVSSSSVFVLLSSSDIVVQSGERTPPPAEQRLWKLSKADPSLLEISLRSETFLSSKGNEMFIPSDLRLCGSERAGVHPWIMLSSVLVSGVGLLIITLGSRFTSSDIEFLSAASLAPTDRLL